MNQISANSSINVEKVIGVRSVKVMKNYFQKAKVYQTRGIANEAEVDRKFKGEVN